MDKFVVKWPRVEQFDFSCSENVHNDRSYQTNISLTSALPSDSSESTDQISTCIEQTIQYNEFNNHVTDSDKGSRGRVFQEQWQKKLGWLFYDEAKQRAFCSVCTNARDKGMPLPTSSRQISTFKCFADDGFENWRKALERFHRREKSDLHRAAISMVRSKGKQPVTQMIT